ncbi:amidohydrolase family protein [soil metagenome]
MIIDAHAHLWRRARTPQPWIDPVTMSVIDSDFWIDDLVAQQNDNGIGRTVLVQSSNTESETLDLLALMATGRIAGVVGWVDLRGNVRTAVASLRSAPGGHGLVGMRHLVHQDADPDWITGSAVGRGLDALAELGLPFDLVVRADQMSLAERTVAAHPAVSFVLDHLGKPPLGREGLTAWRRDLASLAAHRNVVAKISGLILEADGFRWTPEMFAPIVAAALEEFGPDRLMFGSDWPLVDLGGGTASWLVALREMLPESSHGAIFGATAARIYGMGHV